jgi:hypothetical protein
MVLADAADLTGPLPSELGSLSQLVRLGFQGSGLTGTVPTELTRLTDLGEYAVSLLFYARSTVDRFIILLTL